MTDAYTYTSHLREEIARLEEEIRKIEGTAYVQGQEDMLAAERQALEGATIVRDRWVIYQTFGGLIDSGEFTHFSTEAAAYAYLRDQDAPLDDESEYLVLWINDQGKITVVESLTQSYQEECRDDIWPADHGMCERGRYLDSLVPTRAEFTEEEA